MFLILLIFFMGQSHKTSFLFRIAWSIYKTWKQNKTNIAHQEHHTEGKNKNNNDKMLKMKIKNLICLKEYDIIRKSI